MKHRSRRFCLVMGLIFLAIFVHGVGFFLLRPEIPSLLFPEQSFTPFVIIQQKCMDNQCLQEQAALRDSEPLFLPTCWSGIEEKKREEGKRRFTETFKLFQAQLYLKSKDALAHFPTVCSSISCGEDVLKLEYWDFFSNFGQCSSSVQSLLERSAFVKGIDLDRGEIVWMQTIKTLPKDLPPGVVWAPVEFLVLVDSSGVVGLPLALSSSGVEEIDTILKNYLNTQKLSEKLPSGYFKIGIEP